MIHENPLTNKKEILDQDKEKKNWRGDVLKFGVKIDPRAYSIQILNYDNKKIPQGIQFFQQ